MAGCHAESSATHCLKFRQSSGWRSLATAVIITPFPIAERSIVVTVSVCLSGVGPSERKPLSI